MIIDMNRCDEEGLRFLPVSRLRSSDIGRELLVLLEREKMSRLVFAGFAVEDGHYAPKLLFSHPDLAFFLAYGREQILGWQYRAPM